MSSERDQILRQHAARAEHDAPLRPRRDPRAARADIRHISTWHTRRPRCQIARPPLLVFVIAYSLSETLSRCACSRTLTLCCWLPVKYCSAVPQTAGSIARRVDLQTIAVRIVDLVCAGVDHLGRDRQDAKRGHDWRRARGGDDDVNIADGFAPAAQRTGAASTESTPGKRAQRGHMPSATGSTSPRLAPSRSGRRRMRFRLSMPSIDLALGLLAHLGQITQLARLRGGFRTRRCFQFPALPEFLDALRADSGHAQHGHHAIGDTALRAIIKFRARRWSRTTRSFWRSPCRCP